MPFRDMSFCSSDSCENASCYKHKSRVPREATDVEWWDFSTTCSQIFHFKQMVYGLEEVAFSVTDPEPIQGGESLEITLFCISACENEECARNKKHAPRGLDHLSLVNFEEDCPKKIIP